MTRLAFILWCGVMQVPCVCVAVAIGMGCSALLYPLLPATMLLTALTTMPPTQALNGGDTRDRP